jgi:adenylate cyclase
VELLERIAAWANANEGLLQAIGMCTVAAGVLLSPMGRWLRDRLRADPAPEPEVSRAVEGAADGAPGADRASIAVLPFAAASSDPEHEYLVDGLAEDLVTLLARIPGFFVIARQSTFVYRDRDVDVREIGRELGVRYVLHGRIRKLGDRVRLNAELAETETGTNLWTGRFDRNAGELDRIQDELTEAVVARLEPELVRAEAELARRRPPADWDAWSFYQRAQARLMRGGFHEDTFEEAADLLRKAIEIDPEFALARAQLSLLLAFGHRVGLDIDRDATRREALSEAERALSLEGERSEVQGYVGCAFTDLGQAERGIPILEHAVETNPSNAQAWVALGAGRLLVGEVEQAVRDLEHGLRISPQDSRFAMWGAFHAAGLAQLGRLDEALEETRVACRRDSRAYMPWVIQSLVLVLLGRMEDAKAALAAARKIRPKLAVEEIEILLGPFAAPLQPVWESLAVPRRAGVVSAEA